MEKNVAKQVQILQGKKAELLIELGKNINAQHRAGQTIAPELAKLCEDITQLDRQIGQLAGASIDKSQNICPGCKGQITEDAVFCPDCGFAVQEFFSKGVKFCGSCGSSITADSVWCPVCGFKQE